MKHAQFFAIACALLAFSTAFAQSIPNPTPSVTEVAFETDEHSFAGTLTLPAGTAPFPAVVLVHGSGPLTRDQELLGFAMFAQLADELAVAGIASLRYDKRGVGGSTGDFAEATSADFAHDAEAAVAFLAGLEEVRGDQIGMLGHSEGGRVVPMVAARNDRVAFLVLLAPAIAPAFEDLIHQHQGSLRAAGVDEAAVVAEAEIVRAMLELTRDEEWDALEALLRQTLEQQLATMPGEQVEALGGLETLLGDAMQQYRVWYHFLLHHDASRDLERIDVPILALFGELDVLVDPAMHRPVLEEAVTTADATVRVVPNANHQFQAAVTGGPHEYPMLEPAYAPGVIETIAEWIRARSAR